MEIEIREAHENDLQAVLDIYAQPDLDHGQKLTNAKFEI
jgi:hypothetical protein